MKTSTWRSMIVLALAALSVLGASRAVADQYPVVGGDFWEVTGVKLKDGGALSYANFLASEWKKDQEFAKSKGWIKSYMVLANTYAREGEPDLYLITVTDRLITGPEGEKRQAEYMEWSKTSIADMEKASGNRAEFRTILTSSLLQELKFR